MSDLGKGRVLVEDLVNGGKKTVHLTNVKIVPESSFKRQPVSRPRRIVNNENQGGRQDELNEDIENHYRWRLPDFEYLLEENSDGGPTDLNTPVGQGEILNEEGRVIPQIEEEECEPDETSSTELMYEGHKESTRYGGSGARESFPLSPIRPEAYEDNEDEEYESEVEEEADTPRTVIWADEQRTSESEIEGAVGYTVQEHTDLDDENYSMIMSETLKCSKPRTDDINYTTLKGMEESPVGSKARESYIFQDIPPYVPPLPPKQRKKETNELKDRKRKVWLPTKEYSLRSRETKKE